MIWAKLEFLMAGNVESPRAYENSLNNVVNDVKDQNPGQLKRQTRMQDTFHIQNFMLCGNNSSICTISCLALSLMDLDHLTLDHTKTHDLDYHFRLFQVGPRKLHIICLYRAKLDMEALENASVHLACKGIAGKVDIHNSVEQQSNIKILIHDRSVKHSLNSTFFSFISRTPRLSLFLWRAPWTVASFPLSF